MVPFCSRCATKDPTPATSDTGLTIYWFKISDEGEASTIGVNEDGEITDLFVGILDKDFDYDGEYEIMCPDCVALQSGQISESDLFDD